jgi:hypothetical protein
VDTVHVTRCGEAAPGSGIIAPMYVHWIAAMVALLTAAGG